MGYKHGYRCTMHECVGMQQPVQQRWSEPQNIASEQQLAAEYVTQT